MNNAVCCLWFCVFCKWEWNISKYINVKYWLWIIVSLNVTTSVLLKGVWDFVLIFSHCWFLVGFALCCATDPLGITMDNKEPWNKQKGRKLNLCCFNMSYAFEYSKAFSDTTRSSFCRGRIRLFGVKVTLMGDLDTLWGMFKAITLHFKEINLL